MTSDLQLRQAALMSNHMVVSVLTRPSPEDFWTLLAQSPRAAPWPRRFLASWPDPRPERAGVEHAVHVQVLDVEGKLPRVEGEVPWMEARCLRLTIQARDYQKYKFELLVVPVPRELFTLVQPFDDFEEPLMAWTGGGLFVAFRTLRFKSWQTGCPVGRYADWFPDGRPDERGFITSAGHSITPGEEATALHAEKMAGQLVNKMTLRGTPVGSPGPRKYNPSEKRRFLTDLKAAIGDILDDIEHSDKPYHRPAKTAITAKMENVRDPDTLTTYLRDFDLDLDEQIQTMQQARGSARRNCFRRSPL